MSGADGIQFEREIREQPAVWRRLAAGRKAHDLAGALGAWPVCLVASGSSLCVARLAALALRRRGVRAHALAATEALFDATIYRGGTVVALSQSGQSADLLAALDLLAPGRLIALTNDPDSRLARRADVVIDADAGHERAIPASKSVTAMMALVLWASALRGAGPTGRDAGALQRVADTVDRWLDTADLGAPAAAIAASRSVAIVGAGYGGPVAAELALKVKEATYVHAEGFAAGEFRHGSAAILDAGVALVGIVDAASREIVARPLAEAAAAGALRLAIGAELEGVPRLGPDVEEAFNTLAWTVTGQMLALTVGRLRGVDADAPRGLQKVMR